MPKCPDIPVELIGIDSNAFSILGACTRAMRKAHLPQSEIDTFMQEATSGSYDDLLATCMNWCNVE